MKAAYGRLFLFPYRFFSERSMFSSLRGIVPRALMILPRYDFAATVVLLCALATNFLFTSGHDLQRCIEIVALCGIAIVVISRAAQSNVVALPKSTGVLLLAFLALGLASAFAAHSLRHALYEWETILLLLATIVAIAAELAHDGRRFSTVLHWVGIACGLYSLRVIVMYAVAMASGFQLDMHSLTVGFSNARFLNHTQTALLPFVVLLCLQAPRASKWRAAWFALAIFWWALLFVCEARASVLALGAGCVAALALRRSHARQFITTMVWTALAGLVLYALIFILLPLSVGMQPIGSPLNVLARTAADPTSARTVLWKLALQLIATHPWLGVGPLHFAHEGARLYGGAHPHDWLLQIAAEWGIPALLCLLTVTFLGARSLVRSGKYIADADRLNQQILVTLQVACAAIFFDGLLSGVLVMPQSQLAIALVLGIASAWVRLSGSAPQPAGTVPSTATRALTVALLVAGLCSLIWSVAPDFVRHARGEALTPAELVLNPAAHWSRLWETGYF